MSTEECLMWNGELTCVRYDEVTGAWLIVALHSTQRGPAAGGTRAMTYASVDEAIADARHLAEAMTFKMAAANLPMGGGKSVLALPRPRHQLDNVTWRRILGLHAGNLTCLNGSYYTGPDVGTNSADMDVLGQDTRYVFGRSEEAGGAGSSAEMTAQGVFEAVRVAAEEANLGDLAGRHVLVQGLGAVGARVAQLVAEQDAQLSVSDVDRSRCQPFTDAGAALIPPAEVTVTACDILVPCATGGLIDTHVAASLPCQVVAGAANNVLSDSEAAQVLAKRDIVYAPDFVANAGGAIHLVGREVLHWSPELVATRTRDIGQTLRLVIHDARERGISTAQAARELARQRLDLSAPQH